MSTDFPAQPDNPPPSQEHVEAGVCIVCRTEIPGENVSCPSCGACFHPDCWDYNGGCGVYGCESAAETEGLNTLEIPASYWGREDKDCPSCGQTILAAAMRCKHCGATFQSATPQGRAAYRERQQAQSDAPQLRTTAICLLIFSLIPCTAPLVAIIGSIWLISQRRAIRTLPPLTAALGKIAVAVAWIATLLLASAVYVNQFVNA